MHVSTHHQSVDDLSDAQFAHVTVLASAVFDTGDCFPAMNQRRRSNKQNENGKCIEI